MSYSVDVLNNFCSNYAAEVIEPLPKLRKEAKIKFRCCCGTIAEKSFVRLKVSGMLCADCTMISRREKREATNMEKYGAKCTLQADTIDAKAKATLIDRLGVDNPFKSDIIKAQIKQTNLEKYGAENPYASPIIIRRIRNTCLEKYGTEFPNQVPEIRQATVETNLAKYGVPVSSQAECVKEKARQTNMAKYGLPHHIIPEVLEKAKLTNIRRYGVPYTFQAITVKKKIIDTIMMKYGATNVSKSPIIKERILQTCLKNLGVSYPMQSKICLDKRIKTYLQNYGVEHPLQSPIIQAKIQKSGLKFKSYTTPNGILRMVQGFEPKALDILFKKQQLSEDDVCTDRSCVPHINYKYNNKNKVYFPDIFIKSQNKIIEVKSSWTYALHYEVNTSKAYATVASGYSFEFWIFEKSDMPKVVQITPP